MKKSNNQKHPAFFNKKDPTNPNNVPTKTSSNTSNKTPKLSANNNSIDDLRSSIKQKVENIFTEENHSTKNPTTISNEKLENNYLNNIHPAVENSINNNFNDNYNNKSKNKQNTNEKIEPKENKTVRHNKKIPEVLASNWNKQNSNITPPLLTYASYKSKKRKQTTIFSILLASIIIILTLLFLNATYTKLNLKNTNEQSYISPLSAQQIKIQKTQNSTPLQQFQPKLELFLILFYSELSHYAKKLHIPLAHKLPSLRTLPAVKNPFMPPSSKSGNNAQLNNKDQIKKKYIIEKKSNAQNLTQLNMPPTHSFRKEFSLATFSPLIASPLLIKSPQTIVPSKNSVSDGSKPNNILVLASTSGAVYTVNPQSGNIIKTSQLNHPIYAQPKVFYKHNQEIIPTDNKLLVLHSPASFHFLSPIGEPILKSLHLAFQPSKENLNNNTSKNEKIIASALILPAEKNLPNFVIATLSGRLLAFDGQYGKRIWASTPASQVDNHEKISMVNYSKKTKNQDISGFFTTPLFIKQKISSKKTSLLKILAIRSTQKMLVAADLNGDIHAVNANDGKLIWRASLNSGPIKAPLLLGNYINKKKTHIAVVSTRGILTLLTKNGEVETQLNAASLLQSPGLNIVSAALLPGVKRNSAAFLSKNFKNDVIVFASQNGLVVRADFKKNRSHLTTLFHNPSASFIAKPQVVPFKSNSLLLLVDRNHGLILINPFSPKLHAKVKLNYPVTATPAINSYANNEKFSVYVAGEDGMVEGFSFSPLF